MRASKDDRTHAAALRGLRFARHLRVTALHYLKAINDSLDACMPLKFTGGLGGAIAGRPIMIRYVDNRELAKQPATP